MVRAALSHAACFLGSSGLGPSRAVHGSRAVMALSSSVAARRSIRF